MQKKLRSSGAVPMKTPAPQIEKVFASFFKKEGLSYLAELINQRSLDRQVGIHHPKSSGALSVS